MPVPILSLQPLVENTCVADSESLHDIDVSVTAKRARHSLEPTRRNERGSCALPEAYVRALIPALEGAGVKYAAAFLQLAIRRFVEFGSFRYDDGHGVAAP